MSVLDQLTVRDLTDVLDDVCRRHHVTREEVCGRIRTKVVCAARHDLWWRLYHHGTVGFSFVEIARLFGRNHTTVMHGIRAWARVNAPEEEPLSLSA